MLLSHRGEAHGAAAALLLAREGQDHAVAERRGQLAHPVMADDRSGGCGLREETRPRGPAYRLRARAGRSAPDALVRLAILPVPVADLRHVLAVGRDVAAVLGQPVAHELLQVRRP